MAYTVLARKYRSQTFEDVVGQDAIAQTLRNAIKTGRVAHAYLFCGTRGVGKTTMARILAKALNCLESKEPTGEPCCRCESCVAVNTGDDIDVIEIDGASNNGVDEVRRLRENAAYRPARSRYKIYIIDEVHMLSTAAFNALLKILEEPPSHVKFIFATTEPNKVLATIQSRCQRFDFRNIGPKEIAGQLRNILQQEKLKYEDDLLITLSRMANGSMRDALSLLDRLISTGAEKLGSDLLERYLGRPSSSKVCDLISRIGDNDASGALKATQELINSGLSEVQIVDCLIDYMRDVMVVKTAGTESEMLILTAEQQQQLGALAEKFDIAALVYNITALEKLRWSVKNSDSPRALLDALLVRFAMSEHFLNVDELLARLQGGAPADGIKKKYIAEAKVDGVSAAEPPVQAVSEPIKPEAAGDPDSVRRDWPKILNFIGSELGPGTQGLLNGTTPGRFEGGVLTICFPAAGQMQKQMCESNGRTQQIQTVVSKYLAVPVKVQLELETASEKPEKAPRKDAGTAMRRKNELINDEAVKMVITGLDATITGIEEI
jgi:DNA polymerase-3 subunit gamma/tau